jgi:hypothetical protein
MLETFALVSLAATWLACTFTALQLIGSRDRIGLVALVAGVAVGFVLVATRSDFGDIEWLRDAARRSDALAIGALTATLGTVAGSMARPGTRRRTWAIVAAVSATIACAATGIAALALGRSSWYWEFVAVIVAGILMTSSTAAPALRRASPLETRVLAGGVAAFGGFLMVGATLLLLAWRALE